MTGAAAKIPGLVERVASDLISNRPFQSETGVTIAQDPSFDAFRGMQVFSRDFLNDESVWITKAEYEERGPDILKVHCCSNL